MADRSQYDPAAELRETRRALKLAATEAHELRTALAEVIGYCVSPSQATTQPDGSITIDIHADALERWRLVLAGKATR